ncbi:GNAT family N-acetyltransferase [Parabacteroides bouchesdurhonensis]|uniref:GNAT family N-acetyltransferase n=1 Tax=Parabacteroides bouchesdurhonensis TaxID=1936995 RepID=UPI000E4D6F90|nr:GNAT family N-acetyltransferase [Parabacteroides bouchesdurhonensis]RHJ94938.1 N-acetyltransferase [Bacteroides sp. AM07-16]
MNIRFATVADSVSLLNIYAQYIDTPITFECSLPSEQEFAERIRSISNEYPYLVCEENGEIIGYAYAHRLKEREAYQWDAELSVYLDKRYTSKGLGRKLYCILMEILKLQRVKTVYGLVTIPNVKSEKLHLSLGFKCAGTYHNTGYKSGAWHDVSWFEKEIAPYQPGPAPLLSIQEIPKEKLEGILRNAEYTD